MPADGGNGPVREYYDCGGEDYFNPYPPAGSWLARNPAANVYTNPLLGDCGELISSCVENRWDGADRDGDGLDDHLDSCPDSPGRAWLMGCADSDRDGLLDHQDSCPTRWVPRSGRAAPSSTATATARPTRPTPARRSGAIGGCPAGDGGRGRGPQRAHAPVRAGKRHAGRLTITATPSGSRNRVSATARLRLPAGRYRVEVCVGAAVPSRTRRLARGASGRARTVSTTRKRRGASVSAATTLSGVRAVATVTVRKAGRRKAFARQAQLPLLVQ